jgi:predicted glycosyltransferase
VREILDNYGRIIIANEPDRATAATSDFTYAGPFLVERNPELEQKLARRYWTKSNSTRVLCVQGGGGFTPANSSFEAQQPFSFLAAIDQLVAQLGIHAEVEALFFPGPYHDFAAPGASAGHVSIQGFEPDLAWLFASADLALMRAGYGQVTESLSMSCPAVAYPRLEATDDQRQNLSAWREHEGLISWNGAITDSLPIICDLLDGDRLRQLRASLEQFAKPDGLCRAATIVVQEAHNGLRAAAR